jgi:hemolysin D
MNSSKKIEDRQPASGQLAKVEPAELRPVRPNANLANRDESSLFTATNFGQSVVFQQSQVWSRAIVWGIMGITAALVAWACLARIEEAIPAQGKLEPVSDVKKVQAPISGVVKKVFVKNGDKVKSGDLLVQLESTVPESQLSSLASTKGSLEEENRFYRSQLSGAGNASAPKNLRAEVLALTQGRNALISEIRAIDVQLSGGKGMASLSAEDRNRVRTNQQLQDSQVDTGKSEVAVIQKRMSENREKVQGYKTQILSIEGIIGSINQNMVNGKNKTVAELAQVDEEINQNIAQLASAKKILSLNERTLSDITPVAKEGAISRVQVSRQEQEVSTRNTDVTRYSVEINRLGLKKKQIEATSTTDKQGLQQQIQQQQQQISQLRSNIVQANEEYDGLLLSAKGGVSKISSTILGTRSSAGNERSSKVTKLNELDGQLSKNIVENDKKITEIGSQLTQATQNLKYQEIRSPSDGTVFELKAFAEGLVNSNSPDAIVQIVPDNNLVAKIYITNKDIGFVTSRFAEAQQTGQPLKVDVRVDSFNFSEFGDVKGTVEWIGSDVLPPDQANQFYRFPAKIKLDKQAMSVNNKDIKLENGMSINANIKLRDRTVMSIFTDQFTRQGDALKNTR